MKTHDLGGVALAAIGLAATLVCTAPALAVPVASALDLNPFASNFAQSDSPSFTDSQGAVLSPLSGAVTASVPGVSASASATAAWTSAGQGTVTFANGWQTNVASGGGQFNFIGNGGRTRFLYDFVADSSGQLIVTYAVSTTVNAGDAFGRNPFHVRLTNLSTLGFDNQTAGDGAGVLNFNVVAGESYSFTINEFSNLSGGIGIRDVEHEGSFSWTAPIDDVVSTGMPEPAAAGLLGLALVALAGARLARRRPGVAAG